MSGEGGNSVKFYKHVKYQQSFQNISMMKAKQKQKSEVDNNS